MKKIITLLLLCFHITATFAQKKDWLHKDLQKDSIFGISTDKAYGLLKGKKSKQVLVAVIDAGIDTAHADLKSILWVNPKEIRNNKKDDDKNHYADDVYGWSFLGSAKGNVFHDNIELTRLVRAGAQRFGNLSALPADTNGLAVYQQLKKEHTIQFNKAKQGFTYISSYKMAIDTVLRRIGKKDPSAEELRSFEPLTLAESDMRTLLIAELKNYPDVSHYMEKEWDAQLAYYQSKLDYSLNLDYDPRNIVGDQVDNLTESTYGTADVTGPNADHGTHVAGIIAAVRHNGFGIDGVADHVKIMVVRAIPDGDERDKDVANAIRYAVDNGARVINMSFGKPYSPDKLVVDDAVRYAMQKDVLLIHSAGNEGLNVDLAPMYPTRKYADGKGIADAWIEVGASGERDDTMLAAGFSNYGAANVDVFAPGVKIYSSVPGSKYEYHDGTSMAAPVVSGIAALIRSYFPTLTALQVKDIIMKSVVKVNHTVLVKGKDINFSSLCVSGGIVNAYEAIKLAQQTYHQ